VPEGGAANEAIAGLLAGALGRPASAARLESGATARVKTFLIAGEAAAMAQALAHLTGESA
jgi:uncharacterized protein YggU (UPF0235/DUF167 family)